MDFDKYIAEQQAALDKMQREMEQQLVQAQQMAAKQLDAFQNAHKKYCPECGAQMESYAYFCPECGTQVGNSSTTTAPTNTTTAPTNTATAPTNAANDPTDVPEEATIPESDQPQVYVDICEYEGWNFNYTYEAGGRQKSIDVLIMCEDDGLLFLDDMPLPLNEYDFKHCQDIHDCGVLIAKHAIKDNDGEVQMSFRFEDETLTGVDYSITLTPNLDYAPLDESNEMELTLGANCSMDAMRCYIYELDEETARSVKDCIEDDNIDGIYDFIEDEDCVFDFIGLWGDEDENLYYELTDSDGEIVDSGEIHVSERNVFQYNDFKISYGRDHHPRYLLVRTDSIKNSVTTFTVPADFKIGGVHFEKYNFLDGGIYNIGDTITNHDNLHYAGKVYSSDSIDDCGSLGDCRFELVEWDESNQRYRLIANTDCEC